MRATRPTPVPIEYIALMNTAVRIMGVFEDYLKEKNDKRLALIKKNREFLRKKGKA